MLKQSPEPDLEPPFSGEWRHNNGYLICGTLRIAVQDFDTSPSKAWKKEVFDWITRTLNAEQEKRSKCLIKRKSQT